MTTEDFATTIKAYDEQIADSYMGHEGLFLRYALRMFKELELISESQYKEIKHKILLIEEAGT